MDNDPPGTDPLRAEAVPPAERQVQDLRVILDVARVLAATADLDELLGLILDAARQVLAAERATLFLYDPAANELYSKIAHGAPEIRFPADQGIAGSAVQERRTINIPDAYADSRFNPQVDRQTGYHTRCLLTVPLTGLDQQLVGALQVLNKRSGTFTGYDEFLAEALAAQIGVALQRGRLVEHYLRRKQLESALNLARSIQQNLLPRQPPAVDGYDVAGWCQPAEATGGDYYDLELVRGCLVLAVADATGHGIGPALEIAETRALFRAQVHHVSDVGEVLRLANSQLCADLTDGRFVTAFLGILDPAAHRLSYASAGHGPLFWYHAGRRDVTETTATGLPLGLRDPLDLDPDPVVAFAPGDMGIFLTDGFVEAHGPGGELFGAARVARVIVANADRPAAEVIQALEAAVRSFLHGAPPHDDLTAVVLKRCV
jgi:phosphoserine phosphatase